jgi:TetR/AcrR family transcriptional regulator
MSDSKRRLLEAAAEEFARLGFAGARVGAIVKRSGVNERMIYHHFGNKEGLYRAVLEDQVGAFGSVWRADLEEYASLEPREGIRRALSRYFEIVQARPLLGPLFFQEAQLGWTVRPSLEVAQLPVRLRELFERGKRDGSFRADADFEVFYAAAIVALFGTPVVRGLLADRTATPEGMAEVGAQVVALLLDGITRPASKDMT